MLSTEFEDLFLSYFVMQWHRADLYCKYVCMDITSFLKHVYYHNVMYSRISNKRIDVCFPETCNNKSGSWADLQILNAHSNASPGLLVCRGWNMFLISISFDLTCHVFVQSSDRLVIAKNCHSGGS